MEGLGPELWDLRQAVVRIDQFFGTLPPILWLILPVCLLEDDQKARLTRP